MKFAWAGRLGSCPHFSLQEYLAIQVKVERRENNYQLRMMIIDN